MDKVTQLWIRACNSKDAELRCRSVLKRFYFGDVSDNRVVQTGLILHLSQIVDTYCPLKTLDVIQELEGSKFFFNDERDFRTKAVDMLISHIKVQHKDKFKGLQSPCWIKNKYKGGRLDV